MAPSERSLASPATPPAASLSSGSSPFVSDPEPNGLSFGNSLDDSLNSLHDSLQDSLANAADSDFDDSLAGLQQSLDRMKLASPRRPEPQANFAASDNTAANSPNFASDAAASPHFANDTADGTAFDGDLDLESSVDTVAVKARTVSTTPWRRLRSASFRPDRTSGVSYVPPMSADAGGATVGELKQQITGYKIQIRLFKQFLQRLIDSGAVASDELAGLSASLDKPHHDELVQLNQDLYDHLSVLERQLGEKDAALHGATAALSECAAAADDMLALLAGETTDSRARAALSRCQAQPDMPADVKLQVVKMELHKSRRSSTSSATRVDKDSEQSASDQLASVDQLQAVVDQIRADYAKQKLINDQIARDLAHELDDTRQLQDRYNAIRTHCTKITRLLHQAGDSELRAENAQLREFKATVDHKFERYQQTISDLKHEISQLEVADPHDDLKQELLESHRDFNALQEEYNSLSDAYAKFKSAAAERETQLESRLMNQAAKSDKLASEKAQQELNIAVEKQRILKAEKIRLTYKVESLMKDKLALQNTIQNLTDKMNSETSESTRLDEPIVKQLNILEYQLGELLQLDIANFQKLLKSFNKIADDASLKEPIRKIDYLTQKIKDTELESKQFKNLKDYHKSVFGYFVRAVDVIVNDHVKLLLQESDAATQTNDYINKLHRRIDELNSLNDMSYESRVDSPKSRLRIEELTNRWKSEREARVYESSEASRRMRELEEENARLREKLNE